jgi:hypothetical protein
MRQGGLCVAGIGHVLTLDMWVRDGTRAGLETLRAQVWAVSGGVKPGHDALGRNPLTYSHPSGGTNPRQAFSSSLATWIVLRSP